MSTKIEINDLNFYYGDFHALKDMSMSIEANRITALIGPSGCGKSTFLRVLNRMNDTIPGVRVTGEVLLEGENIYAPDADVVKLRSRVGMVFQRPNPFPQSVFDNVAFGPRVLGMTKERDVSEYVAESLQNVGLWEELKDDLQRMATDLTPGQQQRVCIARTIAVHPEVILMDEPCSKLDPVSTLQVEDLMRELAADYTIVIVTHNMQQAARVSDSTGFFWLGEIVEFGETGRLFTRPKKSLTEAYITGRRG